MKRVLAVLLLGLFFCAMSQPSRAGLLFPTSEGSIAIKGKVVDDATGEPLPGVLVVATWRDFTPDYFSATMEGGQIYTCYQLVNVLTAVSGSDGSYEMPAWKGKLGYCQYMFVRQPFLVWYKPGYASLRSEDALESLTPGPDFIASNPHEGTIRLRALGPHYFGLGDNHIENLATFAGSLGYAFGEDEKSPCFWKEESPALLMLFQEERRLSAYSQDDHELFGKIDDSLNPPITGKHCTDSAALAALKQQAQATLPEVPILPFVRFTGFRPGKVSQVQASAPPKELQEYLLEGRGPSHADNEKAVIYHVDVNPANPYYLAVLRAGTDSDNEMPNEPFFPDNDTKLARNGIFGLICPALTEWRAPQSSGSGMYCTWTVALIGINSNASQTISAVGAHRDFYDHASSTWTLTERALVRPKQASLPEILEIHGPDSLNVTTTLVAAGPNRWKLPPHGQPFTLTIAAHAAVTNPDNAK